MAILLVMAIPKIKSTYSLDVETVRTLESLARRWNVPKTEVLRRAIRAAAREESPDERSALESLRLLQASVKAPGRRSQTLGAGAPGRNAVRPR